MKKFKKLLSVMLLGVLLITNVVSVSASERQTAKVDSIEEVNVGECRQAFPISDKDVDFYNFSIPFNRTLQNYFGVEICMDMPEGCDYSPTLYDEYGNQAGKAQWDGVG